MLVDSGSGSMSRACRAALLLLIGTVAGCAHQVPVVLDADPHPIVARQASYSPQDELAIEAAEPVLDPSMVQPGDLFDRIRDGFKLTDVDHAAVTREVEWYVRHPDYLDRTFRRGERYLHHIVNELEARNMPLELALLPIVESAFNPVAYSRARAAGLWQFIPGTGLRYGLKQNWYYDGRRDVLESTRAALDYLTFLANEFDGDWLLAVAAYNTGEANVARRMEQNRRSGKPTTFFHLELPRETRAYVPKLLAMRRIVANPERHGLAFAPIADQPYFEVVHTGGQIDLNVVQELADIPEDEFLALNPAFKHSVTDPDGPHRLLVPVSRHAQTVAGIASLPPDKRIRVVSHRVRSGETLGAIARRYSVSVEDLRVANKLRGNTIHPGQELMVTANPGRAPARTTAATARNIAATIERSSQDSGSSVRPSSHTIRRGETLWSIAQTHGVSLESLAEQNGLRRNSTLKVGQKLVIPAVATLAAADRTASSLQPVTYIVRAGDTLSRIARMFQVRVPDLLNWNNMRSSQVLQPGQRLVMYIDENRRARS